MIRSIRDPWTIMIRSIRDPWTIMIRSIRDPWTIMIRSIRDPCPSVRSATRVHQFDPRPVREALDPSNPRPVGHPRPV
jgi:hypothetical protein